MKNTLEPAIGKRAFFGLGSFQFLSFMRRGIFYSFMYIYLFSLLGKITTTAALGTFTMLASALGQNLLWGRISDRYRLRAKLVVFGELIAGFTYIIVFLVHRSLLDGGRNLDAGLAIILGLSLLEFFWSMSDVGWAALLTDVTMRGTRGEVIGTFNFLASFGRMTGVLIAGFLYGGGSGFKEGTIFYVVVTMLFIGVTIMWQASKSIEKRTPQPRNPLKERKIWTSSGSEGKHSIFQRESILLVSDFSNHRSFGCVLHQPDISVFPTVKRWSSGKRHRSKPNCYSMDNRRNDS
jgi:Na+/melibiose symporter-like transporter